MKKAVLLGLAQNAKQTVFQLEKKKQALEATRFFLHDLGFATWDTAKLLGPLGGGDTGKASIKYSNTLYDDKFFALQKGQFTVQVFFGKKKVLISILTAEDAQEQLKEKMLRFAEYKAKI
jgi:hypothetical protein